MGREKQDGECPQKPGEGQELCQGARGSALPSVPRSWFHIEPRPSLVRGLLSPLTLAEGDSHDAWPRRRFLCIRALPLDGASIVDAQLKGVHPS